jgi:thioredoxin reductase (NADPH)
MFEGFMAGGMPPGGQLTTTTEVENFPGFPEEISGLGLMKKMKEQSLKYGTRIITKTIDKVDFSSHPFKVWTGAEAYQAKSIIIATGASAKRLRIPGENKFRQKGVSACATCDGGLPMFRDQVLVVVGGGDVACEEALFLSKFGSKIIMLIRKNELKASKIMQEKIKQNTKIILLPYTEVLECFGETTLSSIKIVNNQTQEENILECKGLFYAIGHHPNTEIFQEQIDLDERGYIITEQGTGKTNISGIFAAGDVQDKWYRQAITSAGSGCIAALEAERFLETME